MSEETSRGVERAQAALGKAERDRDGEVARLEKTRKDLAAAQARKFELDPDEDSKALAKAQAEVIALSVAAEVLESRVARGGAAVVEAEGAVAKAKDVDRAARTEEALGRFHAREKRPRDLVVRFVGVLKEALGELEEAAAELRDLGFDASGGVWMEVGRLLRSRDFGRALAELGPVLLAAEHEAWAATPAGIAARQEEEAAQKRQADRRVEQLLEERREREEATARRRQRFGGSGRYQEP